MRKKTGHTKKNIYNTFIHSFTGKYLEKINRNLLMMTDWLTTHAHVVHEIVCGNFFLLFAFFFLLTFSDNDGNDNCWRQMSAIKQTQQRINEWKKKLHTGQTIKMSTTPTTMSPPPHTHHTLWVDDLCIIIISIVFFFVSCHSIVQSRQIIFFPFLIYCIYFHFHSRINAEPSHIFFFDWMWIWGF